MPLNATLRDLTFRSEPTQNIRRQARLFGMRTLLEDAADKAVRGITTVEEVMRIAQHEAIEE